MEDLNIRGQRCTVFLALLAIKRIRKKANKLAKTLDTLLAFCLLQSAKRKLSVSRHLRRRVVLAAMSVDPPEEKFTFFWKAPSPFSQFHPSPFHGQPLFVTTSEDEKGYTFAHCEQWMMFNKAKLFGDEETAQKILAATAPITCKGLGRKVTGFDDEIWKQQNVRIVKAGNRLKFTQNQDLMKELLKTDGTTLAEASPLDRLYGIGLSADKPEAKFRVKWRGKNLLGEILTALREEFKAEGHGSQSVAMEVTEANSED